MGKVHYSKFKKNVIDDINPVLLSHHCEAMAFFDAFNNYLKRDGKVAKSKVYDLLLVSIPDDVRDELDHTFYYKPLRYKDIRWSYNGCCYELRLPKFKKEAT